MQLESQHGNAKRYIKFEKTPPTPCMIRFLKIIQIGQNRQRFQSSSWRAFKLSRHCLSSLTIHVWQAGFPADFAMVPVAHAGCTTNKSV